MYCMSETYMLQAVVRDLAAENEKDVAIATHRTDEIEYTLKVSGIRGSAATPNHWSGDASGADEAAGRARAISPG